MNEAPLFNGGRCKIYCDTEKEHFIDIEPTIKEELVTEGM